MTQPNPSEGVQSRLFPTVYIHRGLCGINLKIQCLYIGITYVLVNIVAMLIASMMIGNPQRYLNYESLRNQLSADKSIENSTEASLEDDVPSLTLQNKMDEITEHAILEIGSNGIEILVESLFMIVVSSILIHGIRTEKATFIFPWVVVNVLVTIANFIGMMVKYAVLTYAGVLEMIITVLFLLITSYFILSVYSYYQLLKIRKAKVISFLNNEFQAETGTGYHILIEEDMGHDNPPAYSDLAHSSRTIPFTEKTVPMTEEEDKNKENVLYVQL